LAQQEPKGVDIREPTPESLPAPVEHIATEPMILSTSSPVTSAPATPSPMPGPTTSQPTIWDEHKWSYSEEINGYVNESDPGDNSSVGTLIDCYFAHFDEAPSFDSYDMRVPTSLPTSEPTLKPTNKLTPKLSSELTNRPANSKPTPEPTPEPTPDSTLKPTPRVTSELISEPTDEPTSEPTPETISEPTIDPVVEVRPNPKNDITAKST